MVIRQKPAILNCKGMHQSFYLLRVTRTIQSQTKKGKLSY